MCTLWPGIVLILWQRTLPLFRINLEERGVVVGDINLCILVVTVVIQAAMVHDSSEAGAGLGRGLIYALPQCLKPKYQYFSKYTYIVLLQNVNGSVSYKTFIAAAAKI